MIDNIRSRQTQVHIDLVAVVVGLFSDRLDRRLPVGQIGLIVADDEQVHLIGIRGDLVDDRVVLHVLETFAVHLQDVVAVAQTSSVGRQSWANVVGHVAAFALQRLEIEAVLIRARLAR